MSDSYQERKRLTFEQAEGAEPLPTQLKLKEVSPELRSRLWEIFHRLLLEARDSSFGDPDYDLDGAPLTQFLYDWYVIRCCKPADEFISSYNYWRQITKSIFLQGEYTDIFGFAQRLLRHAAKPYQLEVAVDNALQASRAAYALFDDDTIIPIGSDAERETLTRAFADLKTSEFRGARAHLRTAGSKLTEGDYADSIRESIHAVESVARVLEPGASTLAPALVKLEKSARIHGALKAGFGSLYGFTNDEKGIRHPLLDEGEAQVDEIDALYMLGSCAAFVSYLINRARGAGLII